MVRYFAVSAMVVALAPFQWSAKPGPQEMKTQLKQRGFWKKGCPVGLGDLRLLTVSHLGFDGEGQWGDHRRRVVASAIDRATLVEHNRNALRLSRPQSHHLGEPPK